MSTQRLLRRRELLIAGAIGIAGLAGCGRAGTGVREVAGTGGAYRGRPVKLSYWTGFTGDDGPTMQARVDRFNRDEPRIDVDMNVILWNDFYQKVPAAVYSGNGPDLGVMQVDQVPINAAHQIILPVDDVARRLGIDDREFPEEVIRASTYRGRRYGIPLDLHPLGLSFNEAVLDRAGLPTDRAPADRDEHMDALKQLKGKGVQGSWVSPFLFTGVLQFQSLLFQFGGNLFSSDGSRATWAEEPGGPTRWPTRPPGRSASRSRARPSCARCRARRSVRAMRASSPAPTARTGSCITPGTRRARRARCGSPPSAGARTGPSARVRPSARSRRRDAAASARPLHELARPLLL